MKNAIFTAIASMKDYAHKQGYTLKSNDNDFCPRVEYSIKNTDKGLGLAAKFELDAKERTLYYDASPAIRIPAPYYGQVAQYIVGVNARSNMATLRLMANGELHARVATFYNGTGITANTLGHMEYLALDMLESELFRIRLLAVGLTPSDTIHWGYFADQVEKLRKQYEHLEDDFI